MTTRKELQDWLNRFPEDTIIEFAMCKESGNGYMSYNVVTFDSPTLTDNDYGDGWDFRDFRNNKHVKPDQPFFGKCYLTLGEEP